VITGTTGEVPTLTRDEKLNLYRAVIEAVGNNAAVIAGTGTYNTRESIEASREAEKAGADGLLLTVPYYNKPTQEGIYQHFKAIAGAVDIPCILYNIPGRTSINMAPETIVRASQEIPNVIGVKEASGNLEAMATIVEDAGPDFYVWSGDDSVTLPLLSVGGYGVICTCSNMVASQMRAIIDAFVAGKVVEAGTLHRRLLPLMSALMTVAANPVPIKHAINLRGFKVGGVRQPLWDLDEASSQKLMGIVSKYPVDLPIGAGV
jgi:4-hydroxy-tetrahydrodipicolinate synthase